MNIQSYIIPNVAISNTIPRYGGYSEYFPISEKQYCSRFLGGKIRVFSSKGEFLYEVVKAVPNLLPHCLSEKKKIWTLVDGSLQGTIHFSIGNDTKMRSVTLPNFREIELYPGQNLLSVFYSEKLDSIISFSKDTIYVDCQKPEMRYIRVSGDITGACLSKDGYYFITQDGKYYNLITGELEYHFQNYRFRSILLDLFSCYYEGFGVEKNTDSIVLENIKQKLVIYGTGFDDPETTVYFENVLYFRNGKRDNQVFSLRNGKYLGEFHLESDSDQIYIYMEEERFLINSSKVSTHEQKDFTIALDFDEENCLVVIYRLPPEINSLRKICIKKIRTDPSRSYSHLPQHLQDEISDKF